VQKPGTKSEEQIVENKRNRQAAAADRHNQKALECLIETTGRVCIVGTHVQVPYLLDGANKRTYYHGVVERIVTMPDTISMTSKAVVSVRFPSQRGFDEVVDEAVEVDSDIRVLDGDAAAK